MFHMFVQNFNALDIKLFAHSATGKSFGQRAGNRIWNTAPSQNVESGLAPYTNNKIHVILIVSKIQLNSSKI